MLETKRVESREIALALRDAYIGNLAAPIDGFHEGVAIANADCLELKWDGAAAGHCFIDAEGALLLFDVAPRGAAGAGELLDRLISGGLVRRAAVATRDPRFLSLCLDRQKSVAVDTWLFSDATEARAALVGFGESSFGHAGPGDVAEIRAVCDPAFDGYYEGLVERGQLFALRAGGSLLGIGELRRSATHPLFGDLGVHVSAGFRGRGVGLFIVAKLKEYCRREGLKPMASCDVGNEASKRMLEKAGFVAEHRIVIVEFADQAFARGRFPPGTESGA